MDRNVVIATVLIGLIMVVWLYFLAPQPPPIEPVDGPVAVDTQSVAPPSEQPLVTPSPQEPPLAAVLDSTLAGAQEGEERFITVESDMYQARFSTKGGTLVSFELKEYLKFDQETPIQIVDPDGNGALSMVFTTPANHVIDTRSLFFSSPFAGDVLQVGDQPATLVFEAKVGQGTIRQTYTFTPGEYEVGLSIDQQNASSFMTDEGFGLAWNGGVPFSESLNTLQNEAQSTGTFASSGGEVEGISLLSEEYEEQTFRGDVAWMSVKNKYFAAVVIPERMPRGVELIGERTGDVESRTLKETYTASLMMPPPTGEADQFKLYLGPLEFYRINKYDIGLYDMVDYGWDAFEWMTRPLAKFLFIPAFTFLSGFISNFGFVIIIFAIVIKTVLFPLTKSSYKNMARMRELQPRMQEIKEKYPDNPQKQQEAMMKMYKETGVNPIGGCLPMFLQYPIIIALWQFLQQSIEIRQQGFLWATDLSAPDIILSLPFTIPFYGDYVAGFTLLMGLSLVVQMRIQSTPAAGAQAKVFMYVMPVMLFVIFNSLPSGLSLYYLCYNVLTAAQQKLINKSEHDKAEAAGSNGKASPKAAKAAKLPRNGKSKKGGKRVRTK